MSGPFDSLTPHRKRSELGGDLPGHRNPTIYDRLGRFWLSRTSSPVSTVSPEAGRQYRGSMTSPPKRIWLSVLHLLALGILGTVVLAALCSFFLTALAT